MKVKSLTTEEIKLNEALTRDGIRVWETDLAALIVQLAGDSPSHILVPAIHRNRAEIRELFMRALRIDELSDDPRALTEAARRHLRDKFLTARVGVSGANFAVAETGSVAVVESEGNGRMCTTLPQTLITVMGIEKVIPTWRDLEVYLQLLPRSSTAERMNPYTSIWTGATGGDFHLVRLDNGRTNALADTVGRQALRCIRCSACMNYCPVYERTGGHAYGSVYPGPIGAVLTPQLRGLESAESLPYASTLCGACYDVCPVKIDIPSVLLHLRREATKHNPERLAMRALARLLRPPPLRARAAPRAPGAGPPPVPSLDLDARPAARAGAELPRLVAHAMSRDEILARIRSAVAGAPDVEVPRAYRTTGRTDDVVALFAQRFAEYDATVEVVTQDALPGAIVRRCGKRVVVPPGFAPCPPGAVPDDGLSHAELERVAGVHGPRRLDVVVVSASA